MVRVQVLLERETLDQIRFKSNMQKRSVSNVIRDLIKQDLLKETSKKSDALNDLIDLAKKSKSFKAESKITDLSTNKKYTYQLP